MRMFKLFSPFWLLCSILIFFSACTVQDTPPKDDQNQTKSSDNSEIQNDIELQYGDLLDLTDNRDDKSIVIIKAKVYPLPNGSYLADQNYYNAIDIIANKGYNDCELQYWAVADIDGSEQKIISFTVPQDKTVSITNDMSIQDFQQILTDIYIDPILN